MTPDRLHADLRRIAIHEAGHAIAATAHGFSAQAIIFRSAGCWRGSCETLSAIEDPVARRAFGLGGAVAVAIAAGLDPETLADHAAVGLLAITDGDARLAAECTRADFLNTATLLRSRWGEVESLALRLAARALLLPMTDAHGFTA